MSVPIDWEELAQELGTLRPDGESGGSDEARRAIELLLGEDRLRQAVDYYVAGRRGSELARHVLWQLHPWSAMQRCSHSTSVNGLEMLPWKSASPLYDAVSV